MSAVGMLGWSTGSVLAAEVPAIANGTWTAGGTWEDGQPAASGNTYVIGAGRTVVASGDTNTSTFPGNALTVSGTLDLLRTTNGTVTVNYSVPGLSILDTGTLLFRTSNATVTHRLNSTPAFSGQTSIISRGGGFSLHLQLTAGLSGSGTISYKSDRAGSGTANELNVYGVDNDYAGNWFIDHIHASNTTNQATLRAMAAGALGTGTVTLDTRGRLHNGVTGGIDTLEGVVMQTSSASLLLDQSWNNPSASLSAVVGATIDLGTGQLSTIGSFSIDGLPLAAGTYDAAALTGYGLNVSDTGSITVVPEPASLSLVAAGAVGLLRRRRR